jgi:uncharacterized membrane protein YkvA (DUF1232 family)
VKKTIREKITLKERVKRLKNEVKALTLCLKDPRLGWPARIVILLAVGYALSPIDLIPDFFPVIGFLDDFIILPLLIVLAVKLVPEGLLDEYRERAKTESVDSKAKWAAMAFIIAVWIVILGTLGIWIARLAGARI